MSDRPWLVRLHIGLNVSHTRHARHSDAVDYAQQRLTHPDHTAEIYYLSDPTTVLWGPDPDLCDPEELNK